MSAHVMALQWSSRNRPTATKKRFRNVDFLDAVTGSPQRTLAYDDDDGRRRRGYSCATIGFNDNEHTDTFLYMYIYIYTYIVAARTCYSYIWQGSSTSLPAVTKVDGLPPAPSRNRWRASWLEKKELNFSQLLLG